MDKSSKLTRILGIFAKEPIAGQVKTRLSPPLTLEQAAGLYRLSLQETVETMVDGGFDLAICYAGSKDYFQQTFPGVSLVEQQGEGLGIRMSNALQSFFQMGYEKAALIGSDSPDLPLKLVEQAFSTLDCRQVVIAPAHDGGYVLIGEVGHHPSLFNGISWSSSEVLVQTRKIADTEEIDYQLLAEWDDLDDLDALTRFLQRSPDSRVAEYLCSLPLRECFSVVG